MNSSHSRIGDEPVGRAERLQQHLVPRAFIVEGEALAAMPDLDDAAIEGLEHGVTRWRARRGAGRGVSRPQRILRKSMQQVGEDQFLVLLFVLQPQRDQGFGRGIQRRGQQRKHRRIHMGAIRRDLPAEGRDSNPRCGRAWRAPTAS